MCDCKKIWHFIRGQLWSLIFAAVILLFLGYIRYIEPQRLVVRKVELPVANWPKSRDGLRVALVSDLHLHPDSGAWQKRIATAVMKQQADLILFLGDYVLSHCGPKGNLTPTQFSAFFRKFKAPLGCYAILGNHDIWYGYNRLLNCLANGKIRVLNGRSIDFGDFVLYGVPDLRTGRFLKWDKVSEKPGLLMCHNPLSVNNAPGNIVLSVAGHLHGGQLRWPWNVPVRKTMGLWFEPGLNYLDEHRLFLTSGLGGSRFTERWNCPPEVVILTLRSIPIPANEVAYNVKKGKWKNDRVSALR